MKLDPFQLLSQVDLGGHQKVWKISVCGIHHRKRNKRNGLHLGAYAQWPLVELGLYNQSLMVGLPDHPFPVQNSRKKIKINKNIKVICMNIVLCYLNFTACLALVNITAHQMAENHISVRTT